MSGKEVEDAVVAAEVVQDVEENNNEKDEVESIEEVAPTPNGAVKKDDDELSYVPSEKVALFRKYSIVWTAIMLGGFILNIGLLVYSHLGVSAEIFTSLQASGDSGIESDPDLVGACSDNDNDIAIFVDGSEIRETPNIVLFQLGIACAFVDNQAACLNEEVLENIGTTQPCTNCLVVFTACVADATINGCLGQCVQASPQSVCEECLNLKCEFELNACAGINFYDDAVVDTCVNSRDTPILVPGGRGFDELPIYLAEAEDLCNDDDNVVCLKRALFDEFRYSDDCLTCMEDHAECIATECGATDCNVTLGLDDATCEACVAASTCAAEFNLCSGIDRYSDNLARNLQEEELAFDADGECLTKDQFTLFSALELTFVESVEKSLDGGSLILGLLILFASGIWPYTKVALMFVSWFLPLNQKSRDTILRVLAILGKWSLVDVFAVVLIANGTLIQKILVNSGLPFVLFTEPRQGIYMFAIAAIQAIAQGELIRYLEKSYHKKKGVFDSKVTYAPTIIDLQNFQKKKLFLGLFSLISLGTTLAALFTDNLIMTIVGRIATAEGLNKYNYKLLDLSFEMVSDCSLHDEHGSPTGAGFLAFMFILLVAVIPIIASFLLFVAALIFKPNGDMQNNRFFGFAFGIGNFAALDVWFVTLFIFSNQFAGLIRGAVGEIDGCVSEEQIAAGEFCLGLEGKVGPGGYCLLVAAVTFWFAQCIAVSLMKQTFNFVGTYAE